MGFCDETLRISFREREMASFTFPGLDWGACFVGWKTGQITCLYLNVELIRSDLNIYRKIDTFAGFEYEGQETKEIFAKRQGSKPQPKIKEKVVKFESHDDLEI